MRYLQVPQSGLLWAERSRVRFLMHQIYSTPVESALPEPKALDQCDQLLQKVITLTVKTLGLNTVIIEYSYNPDKDMIYMYVLRLSSDDNGNFQFFAKICDLNIWFQDCGLPKNTCLEEMVSKALEDTVVTEDKKSGAIGSLSMLHSLLVQYIEEDLEGCDTFVFAPCHGC